MSFLRPEAVALVTRLAEPAAAVAATGLLLSHGVGALRGGDPIGVVTLGLGLLAGAWAGAALLRFALWLRRGRAGPGIVEVREGGIAYFGPESGGVAALDLIESVELSASAWCLRSTDGTELIIPDGAKGVERMVDALATLPGFDHMALLAARGGGRMVWRRDRSAARLGRPAATPGRRG